MQVNYQQITKNLLKGLSARTAEVIERRFGLKSGERETLEAIGQTHGITRERVRQIEQEGFAKIRPRLKDYRPVLQHLSATLVAYGNVSREEVLLASLGGTKYQNHVFFLLNADEGFERFSESKDFYSFWAQNRDSVETAKKVVETVVQSFENAKRTSHLDELWAAHQTAFEGGKTAKLTKEAFASYLEISKRVQRNPEGKLGLRDWLEINPRGAKDKAYLVFKKEGKPLHFTKVADLITALTFNPQKKIHVATVHNELIKDPRFVLVGRGVYALKEWGYEPGAVKEVISQVLRGSKIPLSKEEIISQVLAKRIVKKNTITINLQDRKYFQRDEQGRYLLNPVQEA